MFFDLLAAVAGLAAIVAAVIAYLQFRKPRTDTTNVAKGSTRVKQTGGPGVTRNEATDSFDVDQSG